ncbi:sigma-54-dependent Fis family transcriptional regulator [Desulfosporosinus sp. SYSU MS00001]|uniref:sigma-54-dependent Fis family transcriptional regulator n=1 Tax=Desulfosporosinus sp. SYSU MS00001 TaxID=3416284 RepID=UPI003CE9E65D
MIAKFQSSSSEISMAWKQFISDGIPRKIAAAPEIMESWQRCYEKGVNPYDGKACRILNQAELDDLLAKRKDIIDIAKPFMLKLYEFVKGSGFIVMLTDERGYIMESLGDQNILEKAEKLYFMKGADWTEESVGTNAIGTAVILKRPLQISGAEHYCLKHQTWTCSACPIFDMQGEMIGILDMSGPLDETHLHTLGMVVASAEAIMDQMELREKNKQLLVANNRMVDIFKTMSDGVMIINENGVILQINPVALQIFGRTSSELLGKEIKQIFGLDAHGVERTIRHHESFSDLEVMVDTAGGRIHCLSSGVPILDNGILAGAVIIVRPMEKVQKLVNRFSGAQAIFNFKDVIGKSREMARVIHIASQAAVGTANVLLEGESGTGKEVLAQAIHNRSNRRKGPFVAVNCGAIPRELIASEIFGYTDGAFTGAKRGGRPGKFELAAKGTLFLDEIGDMPLEQQVALLRVLQDKKVSRIGDDKLIPVDFRIICATNKNLEEEVEKGNFRKDLYYRINVVKITIPPLRHRPEDILELFNHFLKVMGGEKVKNVDSQVIEVLMHHAWPGNVRELQNVVERLISMVDSDYITLEHLPPAMLKSQQRAEPDLKARESQVNTAREKRKIMQAQNEYREILTYLSKHGGNISEIAKEMGVSRNTIYRKMRQYNINF